MIAIARPCRYVSNNALVAVGPQLPVAALMNKAGAFVTPNASVFPFFQSELPPSISSPDWYKLDLNDTGGCPDLPCRYPRQTHSAWKWIAVLY